LLGIDKGNLLCIPTNPHVAANILGLFTVKGPTIGAHDFKLIAFKIEIFIKTDIKNKYKNGFFFFTITNAPS